MTVYSFFLYVKNKEQAKEFSFILDRMNCLSENYKGIHPTIKPSEGGFYILYGITNQKKDANLFMETRNMSLFKVFKTSMTKDKYSTIINNVPDAVLKLHTLVDVNKMGEKIFLSIIMNQYEYDSCGDNFIVSYAKKIFRSESDMYISSLISFDIFSKRFMKKLDPLKIERMVELSMVSDSDIEYFEADYYRTLNSIIGGGDIILCEFEIFMSLFGNTMKG